MSVDENERSDALIQINLKRKNRPPSESTENCTTWSGTSTAQRRSKTWNGEKENQTPSESLSRAEVVSSSLATSDLLYRGVHTQNGSFDDKTTTSLTFKVNASTENMNAVLILFRTPYEAGALDNEAFSNPGLTLLRDPGEGPRVPVPRWNRMHVLHVGGRAPILYLRARREHQTGGVLQRQILHLGRPARNDVERDVRLRGRLMKDTSGVQIEVRRNHFFFFCASKLRMPCEKLKKPSEQKWMAKTPDE